MDFVDLQRREEEHRRSLRNFEGHRIGSARGPRLLRVAIGFGPLVLLFLTLSVGPAFIGPPPAELLLVLAAISVVLPILLLLPRGEARFSRRRSRQTDAKLGAEKQLLLVLRELGSLTPVEAALETSLIVDEADDILTHFAERGHLGVESRDGTLRYTLPGRRFTPEPRTV